MEERHLYRAKHIHALNKNEHLDGTWVQGYYSAKEYINTGEADRLIDIATLCQCTGLKDKNGKLIFEGDIVKYIISDGQTAGEEISAVSWSEYGYYPWMNEYECEGCDLYCTVSEMEVIGNIFDNPELLEVE